MKNLILPCIDPHRILDDIIVKKRRERSERLKLIALLLHNYFDEYEASKLSLEHIKEKAWTSTEKEDLHNCYEGKTYSLDELKQKIKKAQVGVYRRLCPYCLLNTISSFDHYLPKESFPEYSVYGFNLVPCCSLCNEKKSSKFLESGKRLFINLYYDIIPQEKFLYVNIDIINGEPMAEYYLDPSVSDLIREHFDKLELLVRFAEAAPEVFSEVQRTMSIFKNSLEDTKDFMRNTIRRDEEIFSKNYWRIVLYEGLLAKPFILQLLYT